MDYGSGTSDTVDAVKRTFSIISLLKRRNGAGVTELSAELDMSKSGVHKHLSTMVEEGYLINAGGEYRLSFKFLSEGEFVKQNSLFYNVSVPVIDELAIESKNNAYLVAMEHDMAYCVYTAEGENSVAIDVEVGDVIDFHSTAAGKAIIAHLSETEREALLDTDLPAKTKKTITDRDALQEELASIRDERIAYEDEEHLRGMRALAMPLLAPDNKVLGAVAVSGPLSLLPDERFCHELPEIIEQTKNFIEVKYSVKFREAFKEGARAPREFY